MTPSGGGSYKDSHWEPSSSFAANRLAFVLDEERKKSLTAQCVLQQATLIVEDTVAASERGEFFFLHDGQRSYLRSIVAYHVGKVLALDKQLVEMALVVDTNLPGHFREQDRKSLEFFLREFACRIKLEHAIAAALPNGGQKS